MLVLLYFVINLLICYLKTLPWLQAIETIIATNLVVACIMLLLVIILGHGTAEVFKDLFGGLSNIVLTILVSMFWSGVILLILYAIFSYRVAKTCYRYIKANTTNIPTALAVCIAILVFL